MFTDCLRNYNKGKRSTINLKHLLNMASVAFYLDQPYKRDLDKLENQKIIDKVKEYKKLRKSVPPALLNPRETSIYLILTLPKRTVKADRAKIIKAKTDFRVYPKLWDFEAKLPGRFPGSIELEGWLFELKNEVQKAYQDYLQNADEVSTQAIEEMVKQITGKKSNRFNPHDVFKVFEKYIQSGTWHERTVQKFHTLKKRLETFQGDQKFTIRFDNLREFIPLWNKYLINQNLSNNTIDKYVKDLKAFFRWAYDEGYHKSRDFERMKSTREDAEIISLTYDEFEKLLEHQPGSERLQRTKDIFVFQCLTGQRWADIASIQWSDIDAGIWTLHQKKGRKTRPVEIPLHEIALTIIEKYQGQALPLPVDLSNQKYNEAIKDLCGEARINKQTKVVRYSGTEAKETITPKYKLLSSHSGRRTFINIAPVVGIPMEVAMSITGHKSLKVVQDHYRKVSVKEKQAAIKKMQFGKLKAVS